VSSRQAFTVVVHNSHELYIDYSGVHNSLVSRELTHLDQVGVEPQSVQGPHGHVVEDAKPAGEAVVDEPVDARVVARRPDAAKSGAVVPIYCNNKNNKRERSRSNT
jgi:hypothetical protein